MVQTETPTYKRRGGDVYAHAGQWSLMYVCIKDIAVVVASVIIYVLDVSS